MGKLNSIRQIFEVSVDHFVTVKGNTKGLNRVHIGEGYCLRVEEIRGSAKPRDFKVIFNKGGMVYTPSKGLVKDDGVVLLKNLSHIQVHLDY